jgi:chromosomal replication initiator protein
LTELLNAPENSLALACVNALVKQESGLPSLLILHGASGVGKTRLLGALLDSWHQARSEDSTALLTGESYATDCSLADQQPNGWAELRLRFRGLNLLAIDDIHGMERNPLALKELAHILDELDAGGATIVITAKVAPGQWLGWPPRLVNRFLSGLSVKIDPPSLTTRRRYVLALSRQLGMGVTAEAVEALALASDGFRAINGWLPTLRLASVLERKSVDRAFVQSFLEKEASLRAPSLETIARAVAARFGVTLQDLKSSTRRATVVEPRHLAIYLARAYSGASYAVIGRFFGNRDTKTIRHACDVTARRLNEDPALLAVKEALCRNWQSIAVTNNDDHSL